MKRLIFVYCLCLMAIPGLTDARGSTQDDASDPAAVRPFTIDVAESVLDDLRARLGRTRFPDQLDDVGWDYGTDLGYMRELVTYWRDEFDWRAQERARR